MSLAGWQTAETVSLTALPEAPVHIAAPQSAWISLNLATHALGRQRPVATRLAVVTETVPKNSPDSSFPHAVLLENVHAKASDRLFTHV